MVSDSKSLFRSILKIWGKPAENFALLTNGGHEIFVGRPRSVRGKYEESVLKGSRLLAALPTPVRPLDCESSGNRGFEGIREGTDSGAEVLEILVAHRLIDLDSEWHSDRHRYEHTVGGIYLAKTRWNPTTSYIAVWTFS